MTDLELLHLLREVEAEISDRKQPEPVISQKPGEVQRTSSGSTTLILQKICCGKSACRTCHGRSYAHGPYWYAYMRINGRLISRYVGKNVPR
jgi:Family of unknown function (DUF6788)